MSELRYNPFLKDWIIISLQRQSRPNMPKDFCPFCPGSGKVPENYDVLKYDNDFPVMEQNLPETSGHEGGFFKTRPVYGKCEVILYHPDHTLALSELPAAHIRKLVDLWCERFEELSLDEKIKYIYIFENRGKEVGVTMPHPHGQLYAFGWVPKVIQTELDASLEHYVSKGRCLTCETLESECAAGARMVLENDSFSVFVPFFSTWPYGTYVVLKGHKGSLPGLCEKEKDDLADILKKITGAYDALFDMPFPYMMALHQQPVNTVDTSLYFHFHIEFYPPLRAPDKQYFRASAETGAGAYCNVVSPEEAAKSLREAFKKIPGKGA